jgi:hypothetical protein
MEHMLRRATDRTESNALHRASPASQSSSPMARAKLSGKRSAEKNAENGRDSLSWRPLINELLRRPNRSAKAFAQDAGAGEPAVSDGLARRKAFDMDWLARQDDAFLLDFIDLVIAQRHLTPEAKRIARANQLAEVTRLLHLSGERGEERTA